MEAPAEIAWTGYSLAERDWRWQRVRDNAAKAGLDCVFVPLCVDGRNLHLSLEQHAGGRLLARLWAGGVNTTNSYNNAGDLAAVAYSDATPALGYGYDRRGRQNTVTNGSMVSTLSLSDAGQVLNEAWSGGVLNGLSVSNGYDHLLRRTILVARNSSTPILQQSMAFDATSRLRQITESPREALIPPRTPTLPTLRS